MDKVCFVVCPIGQEGSEIRSNSDKLLRHILQPVCDECGFECIRVDELNDNNSITETIISYLQSADLVIADLSNHNPNAFYELGYRTALKKPVIHVKNDVDSIPFDVAGIRTITYNLHDLDKAEETKSRLKKTIQNLKFDKSSASNQEGSDYNRLLAEIFKIQDELKEIQFSLGAKDNTAVSILADKLSDSSLSPETAFMQALPSLILGLISNPEALKTLINLSKDTKDHGDSLSSDNSSSTKE